MSRNKAEGFSSDLDNPEDLREGTQLLTTERDDAAATPSSSVTPDPAAASPSKKSSKNQPGLCHICGRLLPNMFSLYKHFIQAHSTQPQFPCPLCWESYDTRADLADHLATHQDLDSPFRCRSCDLAFPNLHSVQDHQVVHNPELVHQCGRCPRAFDTIAKLHEHYHVHNRGLSDISECSLCGQQFPSQHRLVDHVKRMHTKMYMCLVCPMYTSDSQEFVTHYKTHREVTSAPCPICHKAFLKSNLAKHVRDHPETSLYLCHSCDPPQILTSRTLYEKHLKTQKHRESFHCKRCNKSYTLRSRYRDHMERQHSRFICQYCEEHFGANLDMINHVDKEHPTCIRKPVDEVESRSKKRERDILMKLRAFEIECIRAGEGPATLGTQSPGVPSDELPRASYTSETRTESADVSTGKQQDLGIVRNAPVTFYTYETSPESADVSTSQQHELGRLRKTFVTLDTFDTDSESASFSGSQEQESEIAGEESVTLNTPVLTPDTAGSSGGEQETSETGEASVTLQDSEGSTPGGG